MTHHLYPRSRVSHWRHAVAVLLMAVTLLAQLPIPLLQAGRQASEFTDTGKDLSIPFPCMHKACGCRSARECWRSCCCSKPHERRALFARLGVDISPGWGEPGSDVKLVSVDCSDESGACCSVDEACIGHCENSKSEARFADEAEGDCPFCATTDGQAAECNVAASDSVAGDSVVEATESHKPTIVLVSSAARCRGLGWAWGTTGVAVITASCSVPKLFASFRHITNDPDEYPTGDHQSLDPRPPRVGVWAA